jgi:hypothetical protein
VDRRASKRKFAKYEIWIGIAINACAKRQEEDNAIKNLMKISWTNGPYLTIYSTVSSEERSANPPRYIQSIRWKDGEHYGGKKGGWELVVTKLNEPNPVFGLSLLFLVRRYRLKECHQRINFMPTLLMIRTSNSKKNW